MPLDPHQAARYTLRSRLVSRVVPGSGLRMLDARRMLWLLTLLSLGVLPACLTMRPTPTAQTLPDSQPTPTKPPQFAELAKLKPGQRVASHPSTDPTATAKSNSSPSGVQPAVHGIEPPGPPPNNSLLPAKGVDPQPFPISLPPVTIDPPLVAALRAFMDNDPTRAVDALKSLDKSNQEFVLAVLPALARGASMNMSQMDPADAAVLTEQLHAAAERLEPRAALRVDKVTFCRRVLGFGRFDPWPEGQAFQPNDLAELYLEIRHLRCETATGSTTGETFVTRLISTLEIRDAAGRLVDQTDPADWHRRVPVSRFERTDFSRSPVRDYFLKYRFPIPATPGSYTVTVEVRDPVGGRTARTKPIEFRVGP